MILKYANSKSITYVDYYSKMVDNKQGLIPAYRYDLEHTNLNGYFVMTTSSIGGSEITKHFFNSLGFFNSNKLYS